MMVNKFTYEKKNNHISPHGIEREKATTYSELEIQVLAWNRHRNVAIWRSLTG
jgi:hypothetical protein